MTLVSSPRLAARRLIADFTPTGARYADYFTPTGARYADYFHLNANRYRTIQKIVSM
jgi:hypothetical protein